jgi:two-component system heavy metal sensor histidine kinase CusS
VALSSARDNNEYKEVLYSSLEEYERMAQMVGDMLYLAQAENGLLTPGRESVDLGDETHGLFDYFEAWAEERGVSLAQTGSATVPGDRLMLRRALSNLLSNAIRHTPPGQTVRVSLAMHGDKAVVAVENPGPEIPAEHLPRLFDRFYRVDPSRQRKGDGAGLGLAIVKSIIDAHGGSIKVASANQATRFQLTLPALAE